MNDDKNQNFFGELMRQADAAAEEQAAMNEFSDELVRRAEEADVRRAAEFVENFLAEMVSFPSSSLRSNRLKVAKYGILFSAANDLSTSGEEDEPARKRRAMWEKFSDLLARGEWHLLERDDDRFRKAIIAAFKTAAQHPGFSFVTLAESIKKEERSRAIRALRRKLQEDAQRAVRRATGDGIAGCPCEGKK